MKTNERFIYEIQPTKLDLHYVPKGGTMGEPTLKIKKKKKKKRGGE